MQRDSNAIALGHSDIDDLVDLLHNRIQGFWAKADRGSKIIKIFPVPRGGVPVAYALMGKGAYVVTNKPEAADIFIDDILDTGSTKQQWSARYPWTEFFAMIDKKQNPLDFSDGFVVFPWEESAGSSVEDSITRILQVIGEDPTRQGLIETPKRVAKAWAEWTEGYAKDPAKVLKCFEDGADDYDQIVLVKNIPFYSHCEHHMAPFFGICHVGYIPNKRITGLSKIPELVNVFARRLQVQERLTVQVAESMMEHLQPLGVGVIMDARHMCMESRGKKIHGQSTTTSAFRGIMAHDAACKAEFLSLTK